MLQQKFVYHPFTSIFKQRDMLSRKIGNLIGWSRCIQNVFSVTHKNNCPTDDWRQHKFDGFFGWQTLRFYADYDQRLAWKLTVKWCISDTTYTRG